MTTDGSGNQIFTYGLKAGLTTAASHVALAALYRMMRVVHMRIKWVPTIPIPPSTVDSSVVMAYDPDSSVVPATRNEVMTRYHHVGFSLNQAVALSFTPTYETGSKGLHSTIEADIPNFGFWLSYISSSIAAAIIGRVFLEYDVIYDSPIA